jgi:hypothetical protein
MNGILAHCSWLEENDSFCDPVESFGICLLVFGRNSNDKTFRYFGV